MLNSRKANSAEKLTGKKENTSWLIDIGATNHKTGRLEILNDLKDISACPVGLPNSGHVLTISEGSIELDKILFLRVFFMCLA